MYQNSIRQDGFVLFVDSCSGQCLFRCLDKQVLDSVRVHLERECVSFNTLLLAMSVWHKCELGVLSFFSEITTTEFQYSLYIVPIFYWCADQAKYTSIRSFICLFIFFLYLTGFYVVLQDIWPIRRQPACSILRITTDVAIKVNGVLILHIFISNSVYTPGSYENVLQ